MRTTGKHLQKPKEWIKTKQTGINGIWSVDHIGQLYENMHDICNHELRHKISIQRLPKLEN